MKRLQKVGLVIRHVEQTQRHVAQRLSEQKRQFDNLRASIEGLSLQWQEIERLLQGQKLADRVVDRATLFMLQQRQAVLRQQQYQLNFERDRLREQIETLEKEQAKARAEMSALKRKQEKFAHWSTVEKRRQVLQRLQREDLEIEDRVAVRVL